MPLSAPAGGGIDRRTVLVSKPVTNNGAAALPALSVGAFDGVRNRGLIGGDSAYVGIIDTLQSARCTELPTLPDTVIATGTIENISLNNIDNGIIVQIGNAFARTADDGVSWIDITTGFVLTYQNMLSWRSNQLIALHTRTIAPVLNDYDVSLDNGASFTFRGLTQGVSPSGREILFKTEGDGRLFAVAAGGILAYTDDDDLTTAVWTTVDYGTQAFPVVATDMAATPDGTRLVMVGAFSQVITSIDGGDTWTNFATEDNYMLNIGGIGPSITSVEYVAGLDGFVLFAGTLASFIPAAGALDVMLPISLLREAGFTFDDRNSWSDGADLMILGSSQMTTAPAA